MLQDVKFALRLFNRHRGYAAVAILTVALGVGANTAVFSVADSVLFRPLPFADAERLFVLRMSDPKSGQVYGSVAGTSVEAARGTGLFDVMAPVSGRATRAYVRRDDGLDALNFTPVSREYVDVLGVRPALGRAFQASDAGTRAVLLSYRSWIRKYRGDPAAVGLVIPAVVRTMDVSRIPDDSLRVVGVLPPGLRLPLVTAEDGMILMEDARIGATTNFPPLVRLSAGATEASANAQLAALQSAELVPGKSTLRIVSIRKELAARQDPVLWLLLGASAIVLVVACVNLANLLLARGASRARELAVRAALGGARARLVRLLLAEAICLAGVGAAAGLIAAYWGFRVLSGALPPVLSAIADPAFDVRALGFAVAVASLSAVVFSVVPALRLSSADAKEGLGLARLQIFAPRRGRQLLVALEVAICLALLVGAGLVGRSLVALLSQDLGFGSHRIAVTFELPTLVIGKGAATRGDAAKRAAFVQARLRDVRTVPGVRAAGVASASPFSGTMPDAPLSDRRGGGGVYSVSSGYFRAVGMTLVAGRDFLDDESFSNGPVGVLNESAARSICGTASTCVGQIVRAPAQPARTVVGVVRDARLSLTRDVTPVMYVPFDASQFVAGSLVIDSDDTPENRDGLKRALSASPDARVVVRSLDESRDREISPYRFNALVVGAFAALTLALSIVGVYGVMSAVVGERTREYGIRIALGATRARVHRHVIGQAAVPIGCGVAAGVMLAVWASRFVASLLYGIVPLDAGSFAAAIAGVLTSAVAAAYVPARRAGRVDPIVVLKAE